LLYILHQSVRNWHCPFNMYSLWVEIPVHFAPDLAKYQEIRKMLFCT
jgi:hypothetical protein